MSIDFHKRKSTELSSDWNYLKKIWVSCIGEERWAETWVAWKQDLVTRIRNAPETGKSGGEWSDDRLWSRHPVNVSTHRRYPSTNA